MKKLLFFLALLPISSWACIGGPVQLDVSESNGFKFKEQPAELNDGTNEIAITAPLEYKGKPFEIGIYAIYQNDILVAKSIHSYINESGVPEFLGYISNRDGFSYSVTFLYGEGRCKAYEFTASTRERKS